MFKQSSFFMAYRALHSINQYQVSIRRGPSRKRLWQPFQTKQLTWPVGQNKLGRALLAFHFPQVLPNLKIICSVYLKKRFAETSCRHFFSLSLPFQLWVPCDASRLAHRASIPDRQAGLPHGGRAEHAEPAQPGRLQRVDRQPEPLPRRRAHLQARVALHPHQESV